MLTEAQQYVFDANLLYSGFNLVIQMPTGSGKSWLAEQAIKRTMEDGDKAIYVAPLKALAEELFLRWKAMFPKYRIGVFTGDYDTYPVPFSQADLLIMTPERLDSCTRLWRTHWEWIPKVTLIVADELHLLGDPKRGGRLEGGLMRFLRLNPFCRTIGLSATLGNRQELAQWLNGIEFFSDKRTIPLTWRSAQFKKADQKLGLLVDEASKGDKTLVFVQSRRRAEEIAHHLKELKFESGYHHAGLSHADRREVEIAFRHGSLNVLVCTGTLEMGLNLPAKRVVLYDLQIFDGYGFSNLPVNNIWQRAGRAGRPNLDDSGEVVLIAPKWNDPLEEYRRGSFEPIVSSLAKPNALLEQVLAEIASGLCRTESQVSDAMSHYLVARQGKLPSLSQLLEQSIESGMLDKTGDRLKVTQLGWIAVRNMISPSTVLLFQKALKSQADLTFFDLLLIIAASEDNDIVVRANFEDLEDIKNKIGSQPSHILGLPKQEICNLLGLNGKSLLNAINTALTARYWTQIGNAQGVVKSCKCYPFEVEQIRDGFARLLSAMTEVLSIDCDRNSDSPSVSLQEKIDVLCKMVETGLSETAITLTLVPGIGVAFAQKLVENGIADIEELANCEPKDLIDIPNIGKKSATKWIDHANNKIDVNFSANRYQEENVSVDVTISHQDTNAYLRQRSQALAIQMLDKQTLIVSGGLDPHIIKLGGEKMVCDCGQSNCKHIIAAEKWHKGEDKTEFDTLDGDGLDIFKLWASN